MSLTVVIVAAVVAAVLLIALHEKRTNAVCRSTRDLHDRTALVTGGTAGMGLVIAEELARRGARVIVACPDPAEGAAGLAHLRARLPQADIIFELLDLGSLKSVRALAAHLRHTQPRLDILVNNAAVGVPGDYLSPDNINYIMHVNYYGTVHLTLLLLPLLIKSGSAAEPSRIVNTSSVSHWLGEVDVDKLSGVGHYWPVLRVYANSKLCLMLLTRELARRLGERAVRVHCVDPGAVSTRIFDSSNKVVGVVLRSVIWCMFKTAAQGAQTALYAALSSEAAQCSGQLYRNCARARGSALSRCDVTAARLWHHSLDTLKLTTEEVEQCFSSL